MANGVLLYSDKEKGRHFYDFFSLVFYFLLDTKMTGFFNVHCTVCNYREPATGLNLTVVRGTIWNRRRRL